MFLSSLAECTDAIVKISPLIFGLLAIPSHINFCESSLVVLDLNVHVEQWDTLEDIAVVFGLGGQH